MGGKEEEEGLEGGGACGVAHDSLQTLEIGTSKG